MRMKNSYSDIFHEIRSNKRSVGTISYVNEFSRLLLLLLVLLPRLSSDFKEIHYSSSS